MKHSCVIWEVLSADSVWINIFWNVAPYPFIRRCQGFIGMCCLCLRSKMESAFFFSEMLIINFSLITRRQFQTIVILALQYDLASDKFTYL